MSEPAAIRAATVADAKAVEALILPLFEQSIAPSFTEEGRKVFRAFAAADALASRLRGGNLGLVLEDAAGIAAYGERDGDHIRLLFVRADRQGEGLSRTVLDALTDGLAAERVTLNASDYALARYRRLGFVPTGPRTIVDGIAFTPMALTLS